MQDKAVMRFVFTQDESIEYQTTMESESEVMDQTMTQKVSMRQVYRVKSVTSEKAALQLVLKDFVMEMNGSDMSEMASEIEKLAIDLEVSPLGKVTKMTVNGNESPASGIGQIMGSMSGLTNAGFLGFTYPEDAIGVGSKWSEELDMSELSSSMPTGGEVVGKMTIEFEVLSRDVENQTLSILAKTKANMTVSAEASDVDVQTTAEVTHTVDQQTGQLVKTSGSIETVTSSDQFSFRQKAQITTVRLPKAAV